jgi:hypothetical protein
MRDRSRDRAKLSKPLPALSYAAQRRGKAHQYFLRGYNLDHGTDMAIEVDEMPINLRTHAHSQGYSDLNWLMRETVNGMDIRKWPDFADLGDFDIHLIDIIDKKIAQLTVGS